MELHHFVSWIYQTKNEFKILDLNIHTLVLQIPFSGDIKGSLKEHAQVIHKYLKDRIPGARLGQPTFPSTSDWGIALGFGPFMSHHICLCGPVHVGSLGEGG